MSLVRKKYKKILNELVYVNSEHTYVKDILREAHIEFEIYYQAYCKQHGIPVEELNKKHAEKLNKVLPKQQQIDENGLVKTETAEIKKKPVDKTLQKMYRKAAMMTHPDKFSDANSAEATEAGEKFKTLTSAFNEKNWAEFLDICEKLDILPSTYKKIIEIMNKEIDEVKKKVAKLKMSFSWRLFDCDEDDNCKRAVIRDFLAQLFGYTINHDVIRF